MNKMNKDEAFQFFKSLTVTVRLPGGGESRYLTWADAPEKGRPLARYDRDAFYEAALDNLVCQQPPRAAGWREAAEALGLPSVLHVSVPWDLLRKMTIMVEENVPGGHDWFLSESGTVLESDPTPESEIISLEEFVARAYSSWSHTKTEEEP